MLPEHDGKNWETEEELLPSGHQAPKLKLIISTWPHLIISQIWIILHHPYCCYVYTLYNLFTHSSRTSLLILLFIKSTVCCPAHLIVLHVLFNSFSILICITSFFFHTYIYVYSFVLHIIALFMERCGPDLHLTAGYILYNCVCDK